MQNQLLTPRWTPIKYHPVQAAFWAALHDPNLRQVVAAAGRGSGKTELAKRWLVSQLGNVPKPWARPRYFFAGPTLKQTKRIAWRDLLDLIPDEWIDGGKYGRDVSHTDMIVRTVFGSELHVVGLDKPHRIEGDQWDDGVIDESSDVRPKAHDVSILPALTWRGGKCARIGVPKRQGVGVREFKAVFRRGIGGHDPAIRSFTWPSRDIVPAAALEEARRTLDPKDFREQFEASWETAGGRAFHAFDRERNVRPCEYHADRPLIVGCDFNVNPMAWGIGHKYDDHMEWIDEIWLRDTNTPEAAGVLADRYSTHRGGIIIYGDASGDSRKTSATSGSDYKLIADHPGLKRLGIKFRVPRSNPGIKNRLAACNAMLCNAAGERRMFMSPTCEHLIDDLEARAFKDGSNELDDSGDIGHISDAIGYTIVSAFPIRLKVPGNMGVVAQKGSPLWVNR